MKLRHFELFWIFFKISLILIGGGYVLIPIALDEFTIKRKLLTKEEFIDFYTIAQCLPGVIVIKIAILIGYHLRGKTGALSALAGVMTPPFFAILIIANLLSNHNMQMSSIVNIVAIAVIVLTSAAFYELAEVCLKNIFSIILFLMTIILFVFTKLEPVVIILTLATLGMAAKALLRKIKGLKW